MKAMTASRVAAALLASLPVAAPHSWIEAAFRVAPNGSFVGAPGFPRGYVPRSDPGFSDKQAQHLVPVGGVYRGDELLNKFPPDANPRHPRLEAAPGDTVAVLHLENGHVTLPQNQANKPLNRGTVFLYGTARPRDQERLFDVHLLWNRDGSGGDGRGRLLATRNYDDGQCFQDNRQPLAEERVARLAGGGATVDHELKCQSTITIPRDVPPGSVYTVYWFWDWPTLNPDRIDMQATKNGRFPWAGSFMRGDRLPDGWTMDMIRINESYASVVDIDITDKLPGLVAKKDDDDRAWAARSDVYKMGIKAQMTSAFDVKVDDYVGGGSAAAPAVPAPPTASGPPSASRASCTRKPTVTTTTLITVTQTDAPSTPRCSRQTTTTTTTTHVTVPGAPPATKTVTVPATTVLQTVYVAGPPPPSTLVVTQTTHVPAAARRHLGALYRRH